MRLTQFIEGSRKSSFFDVLLVVLCSAECLLYSHFPLLLQNIPWTIDVDHNIFSAASQILEVIFYYSFP